MLGWTDSEGGISMARRTYTVELIIGKLGEAEILMSWGTRLARPVGNSASASGPTTDAAESKVACGWSKPGG